MAYLAARNEAKQIDLYCWDMIWKLVSNKFNLDIPMPSDIWNNKHKVDRRTKDQIIKDLLNGLGGD